MYSMKPSEYIEGVGKRLNLCINPVTIENLKSFIDGFNLGYILAENRVQFHDKIYAWKQAVALRGWKVNALGPQKEMQEKGMSEKEIIDELVQIEIQLWKFLEERLLI